MSAWSTLLCWNKAHPGHWDLLAELGVEAGWLPFMLNEQNDQAWPIRSLRYSTTPSTTMIEMLNHWYRGEVQG